MALARDFNKAVAAPGERDPAFARALLDEAATLFLSGKTDSARLILRDLVNATLGFEQLSRLTGTPVKSLHHMLSPKGNPSMDTLAAIFGAIRKRLQVSIKAQTFDMRKVASRAKARSELELARAREAMDALMEQRRPPPRIRQKLDLGYRIKGQSVEIFEIRPAWRGRAGEKQESAVAKATYVRTRDIWRVFWQRADLKWHRYEPKPEVNSIDEFTALVLEDAYACFFG